LFTQTKLLANSEQCLGHSKVIAGHSFSSPMLDIRLATIMFRSNQYIPYFLY